MELSGKIASDKVIQVKFAISGKISVINVNQGQSVKKNQLLATLDKGELQAYLDRSLKYFEQTRAEFDEKQKQNTTELEKRKIQSELDISIKNVEIAKFNLESTNLYSPIDGIVAGLDPVSVGVNITPASFVVTILDPNSFYFEAKIKEEIITDVKKDDFGQISLKAFKGRIINGRVSSIGLIPSSEGIYPVKIVIDDQSNLRVGLKGEVLIKKGF